MRELWLARRGRKSIFLFSSVQQTFIERLLGARPEPSALHPLSTRQGCAGLVSFALDLFILWGSASRRELCPRLSPSVSCALSTEPRSCWGVSGLREAWQVGPAGAGGQGTCVLVFVLHGQGTVMSPEPDVLNGGNNG